MPPFFAAALGSGAFLGWPFKFFWSVCVEAARDDVVYLGCFSLAHAVDENKAKAKFDNGLLKIEVPLKAPIKGKRIQIE